MHNTKNTARKIGAQRHPKHLRHISPAIFPEETVTSLIARYNLGVTRSRDVIYFQVDVKGDIRTGKIMKYNPTTGKRVKDPGTPFKINWVHSVMKYAGQLPEDWELNSKLNPNLF